MNMYSGYLTLDFAVRFILRRFATHPDDDDAEVGSWTSSTNWPSSWWAARGGECVIIVLREMILLTVM